MEFPTLVYKCPGSHQCPGGTFDYLAVTNSKELQVAFDAGWSSTLPIACGDEEPETEAVEEIENVDSNQDEPTEDAPPTRAEILKACDELEIPYKKTTSSKELMKLIDEQLG